MEGFEPSYIDVDIFGKHPNLQIKLHIQIKYKTA